MDKTQLLTCTEIQEVGQDPRSLRAGTVLKVLSDLGEEEILIVSCVAPVWLAM